MRCFAVDTCAEQPDDLPREARGCGLEPWPGLLEETQQPEAERAIPGWRGAAVKASCHCVNASVSVAGNNSDASEQSLPSWI